MKTYELKSEDFVIEDVGEIKGKFRYLETITKVLLLVVFGVSGRRWDRNYERYASCGDGAHP